MSARTTAHLLLVFFFGGFVALQLVGIFPYKGLVIHCIEGGLVGALADWFAVTALFRHPLGIPFPHSAIIVEKQNALAESFGAFVEEKFFSREVIIQKLSQQKITKTIASFFQQPLFREKTAHSIAKIILSFRSLLFTPSLSGLVSKGITDTLRICPVESILIGVKSIISHDAYFNPLVDRVLLGIAKVIEDQKEEIRGRVRKSLPWFVPGFIDEKLYELLLRGLKDFLLEMQQSPDHAFRQMIREKMLSYCNDTAMKHVLENLRTELLKSTGWQTFLDDWFSKMKEAGSFQANEEGLSGYLEAFLLEFSSVISTNRDGNKEIESIFQNTIVTVTQQGKGMLRELITDTLKGWDTKTLVSSIESSIGEDLQFIRINGALLGSCIGALLFMLQSLFV